MKARFYTLRYTRGVIRIFTGENEVLRQDALREVVATFIAEYTDMAVERLDGEEADYNRMHEAVQSMPFLVARKLIVLRKPGANKEFVENLEQFIADIAETNDVVIVEPKLDKRLGYFKQLKKLTGFQEFGSLDGPGLARYLTDYAKSQGGSLRIAEANLLIDRVGNNQLTLQHEIDKLVMYDSNLTKDTVELLTDRTPQSNIFELLDAAFSGDARRTMKLYDEQRDMRVEPQQILAMLVWQLHILAIAKAAGSRSPETIAKETKLSPFTVRKSLGLARRITASRLKELVGSLCVFDVRLKSEGISADEVVRYYLLALCK
jgi:DNA polymerase-3 subunit delta